MRPLLRVLQDLDLGHLRIIAELWGLDLPAGRAPQAAAGLAERMLDPGTLVEALADLPPASRQALDYLVQHSGRAPLAELRLRFGPMESLGPGKRDREKPWRDGASALDGLRYRGLLALGFEQTPTGIQEFGYLPDEILAHLSPAAPPPGAVPSAQPPAIHFPPGGLVDDAVTVLAALRRRPVRGDRLPPERAEALRRFLLHPPALDLTVRLLRDVEALTSNPIRTDPEAARRLLRGGRDQVQLSLFDAWRGSEHNDLADVPGLAAPGGRWPNVASVSRGALLARLEALEPGAWFSLEVFIGRTRDQAPTFLRPGGDFDSWYLQESFSGRFLHGIEAWPSVEGAYLQHVLTGPMWWLGAIGLGAGDAAGRPEVFRRVVPSPDPAAPAEPAMITPDGRVRFSRSSGLADRYQIARFADWMGLDAEGFSYRLTPRALAAASAQRLDPNRLVALLEAATGRPLPEALRPAIARWARAGGEASLERLTVLRVKSPAVLARLRENRATARFLAEALGPTAVQVRAADVEALLSAAARTGILIDPPDPA